MVYNSGDFQMEITHEREKNEFLPQISIKVGTSADLNDVVVGVFSLTSVLYSLLS